MCRTTSFTIASNWNSFDKLFLRFSAQHPALNFLFRLNRYKILISKYFIWGVSVRIVIISLFLSKLCYTHELFTCIHVFKSLRGRVAITICLNKGSWKIIWKIFTFYQTKLKLDENTLILFTIWKNFA